MAGDSEFAYKTLVFALVIALVLPTMITVFIPSMEQQDRDSVLDDYYDFTGVTTSHTKEAVWVLKGVYTPYEGGLYNYTEDGWIYGARINSYSPIQYQTTLFDYTVQRDNDTGYYRYLDSGTGGSADYNPDTGTGHKAGDIYTDVVFDRDHQSDIFFTKNAKYNQDGSAYVEGSNQPFFYEFTGWRYSFGPLANFNGVDAEGKSVPVVATTTSLSLIWYSYYSISQGGIAGQLILSGSDQGVSYISGDMLVKAFDSTTSTARFSMVFNGVEMGIYVKISPYYLQTMTVQECYNAGYWSIMVTSLSTDADAYSGSDYKFNIWSIFETLIKLMTFDYKELGMDDFMGLLCSFVIVIPLYAGLISLAMNSWQSMAVVGIMAAIQTVATVITNIGAWLGIADTTSDIVLHIALSVLGLI